MLKSALFSHISHGLPCSQPYTPPKKTTIKSEPFVMKKPPVSLLNRITLPCLILVALILMLGSCTKEGGYNLKQIGNEPGNHETMIKKYLEQEVFGKGNIRTLQVAEPHLGVVGLDQGWLVCYKVNAKKPTGQLTGLENRAILVRKGKIYSTVDRNYRSSNCGKNYVPLIGTK